MKQPRYCDKHRGRYQTAEASREPGYLARRFKAIARLQRMRARTNVTQIKRKAA